MPKEQIGYRRLYDAIGCSLTDREEAEFSFLAGEATVDIYFGPRPRLGIAIVKGDKYLVPGEVARMIDYEYRKNAPESSYPRRFFTEVLVRKEVDVAEELSKEFRSKQPAALNQLLALAHQSAEIFKPLADLAAGTIGLRYHRQFVLELINEDFVAKREDWTFNISGPSLELLEELSLNPSGVEALRALLPELGKLSREALPKAASPMAWLLRAWAERDTISKFMALFIPLEIILAGFGWSAQERARRERLAKRTRETLLAHGGDDAEALTKFFNEMQKNQRPSLVSRFESLAETAKIPGWETDIQAFKRFNALRNGVLHRGERAVELVIKVTDEEMKERTSQLEDLTERYVSRCLFGDGTVYPSRWRTARAARAAHDVQEAHSAN